MKKRILIIVYALLLCVTASFAWLSNTQLNEAGEIAVKFSKDKDDYKVLITDFSFEGYLEKKGVNDVYEKVEGSFTFDTQTTVPGVRIPFRIRVKNVAEVSKNAKLVLDMYVENYDADSPNILDMLYIDVVLGDGFAESGSRHVYKKLSEASVIGEDGSGTFSLDIYGDNDKITIPSYNKVSVADGFVALNCSLYYDQNATVEYQETGVAFAFRLE